ncbi:MAG: hypothetical protein HYY92_03205 [Parcubacteria group bacterium]|nr:hypothetical protein [Candidatus Liptonbacteria bacterium]MBI3075190.1 hypothetical protein [Parcubacteria group bacterium]
MLMKKGQFQTLHNFIVDGAKIIFGSLVVGIFAPSTAGEIPWLMFVAGILFTATFLGIALLLSSKISESL